jgi:hypothetical protein
MAETQLEPIEMSYLDELAADIAANGGLAGVPLEQALAAAHARRQAFVQEIIECTTKRSQMARKVLQTTVWHAAQTIAAKQRLAMQARDCVRGALLACESIDSN